MAEYHYTCDSCGNRGRVVLHGDEHDGKSDMVVCDQCGDDVTVELAVDSETPVMVTFQQSGNKMIEQNEGKARTVWSKRLHYEEAEEIFGETWYAKVSCVREVSGYAVWYVRHLKDEVSGTTGLANGTYLLRFYASEARDQAIEFAVLAATKRGDDKVAPVQALDAMAADCPRMRTAASE